MAYQKDNNGPKAPSRDLPDFAIQKWANKEKPGDANHFTGMWVYNGSLYISVSSVVKNEPKKSKRAFYSYTGNDIVSFANMYKDAYNEMITSGYGKVSGEKMDKDKNQVSLLIEMKKATSTNGSTYYLYTIKVNDVSITTAFAPLDKSIAKEYAYKSTLEYLTKRLQAIFVDRTDNTFTQHLLEVEEFRKKNGNTTVTEKPSETYDDYDDLGF